MVRSPVAQPPFPCPPDDCYASVRWVQAPPAATGHGVGPSCDRLLGPTRRCVMTTRTMDPRTTTITDQDVIALERDYWDAMKDRDARTAGRLTAEDCTIVGASGVTGVDPRTMAQLLDAAPYRINDYRFDPKTTRITHLGDDTVAIMY